MDVPKAERVCVVDIPSCSRACRSSRDIDVYASESTNRMASTCVRWHATDHGKGDIPAKKLLLPEPLRPTTTLCRAENGSIWVWSRSYKIKYI